MALGEDDDDERAQELDTLLSIYPELERHPQDAYAAAIDLQLKLQTPLAVTFDGNDTHHLAYLPPLHLEIRLPPEYPAASPPAVALSTTPAWLPRETVDTLANSAHSLWEEYGGGQVLFAYISYLQEAAEDAFGLGELHLPANLKTHLVEYSEKTAQLDFNRATFDCGVCLEPRKGSACHRMARCGHVFCVACLQDYYNTCITEGHVHNVKCMSTECGTPLPGGRRREHLVSPKELLRIPLALETVQRFAQLRRKKKIEADTSMVYCPRSWCQGAMRTTKYPKLGDVRTMDDADWDSSPEDALPTPLGGTQDGALDDSKKRPMGTVGMERLAVCEDCNLAFCRVCLASWHGDFVRCEPRDSTQLTEEEQASLNYIARNTSPCPTCSVPCQKSFGCNHMTCFQCKSHFCYLCSAWLDPGHPYAHFNNPKNKGCYQRLMDMAQGDMVDGDIQFGGARGAEQAAEFWEREALRIQMELNEQDS